MTEPENDASVDEMIQLFVSIWKNVTDNEKTWIQNLLAIMLKPLKIVKYEATKNQDEYELELKEEIVGKHPDFPIGEVVFKQKMKIAFLEEKQPGTDTYQQTVVFPDQGVCFRFGIGWFSKEVPLERIVIEEDQKQHITCTIEGFGQKMVKPASDALKFWKKVQWS